jgi:hypothetical protein
MGIDGNGTRNTNIRTILHCILHVILVHITRRRRNLETAALCFFAGLGNETGNGNGKRTRKKETNKSITPQAINLFIYEMRTWG